MSIARAVRDVSRRQQPLERTEQGHHVLARAQIGSITRRRCTVGWDVQLDGTPAPEPVAWWATTFEALGLLHWWIEDATGQACGLTSEGERVLATWDAELFGDRGGAA